MRRSTVAHALIASLVLSLGTAVSFAQPSMDFRPVPPESADYYANQARESARRAQRDAREAVRRSLDSLDTASEEAAEPDTVDAALAPPAPPAPPTPVTSTGEILRFGSDVTVPPDQIVEGDVVSMGGDIEVLGHVRGSVTSMGGDITLRSGARVDGNIATFGGELREEPGSSVGGERVTTPRTPGARLLLPALAVVGTGVQLILALIKLAFLLGLTWLIVKLATGRTQAAVETVRQEPGTSFLLGLSVLGLFIPSVIVLALVIALLCITIIGIPLALAVALAYGGLLIVLAVWGHVVGGAVLGGKLRERLRPGPASVLTDALWGVAVLQGLDIVGDLLKVVPFFGFFSGLLHVMSIVLTAVLGVFGAGSLIRQEYVRRTVQSWWERARPTPVGRAVEDFARRSQPAASTSTGPATVTPSEPGPTTYTSSTPPQPPPPPPPPPVGDAPIS